MTKNPIDEVADQLKLIKPESWMVVMSANNSYMASIYGSKSDLIIMGTLAFKKALDECTDFKIPDTLEQDEPKQTTH